MEKMVKIINVGTGGAASVFLPAITRRVLTRFLPLGFGPKAGGCQRKR